MYLSFFGLAQAPFSIAPDPRYLFMSERHREALAHLLYGLDGGGGFVLLSGAIGAGKTTVCRCFLEQVPAGCHVAYIFNPKLSVGELLQSVCDEFGIAVTPGHGGVPTVKDHLDPLNRFLLDAHAQRRQCVLVIDEAQMLSAEVLEQLRLLTNLETSERKLLQIILIGQPELRGLLARPELEQLAQRVIARFHLDALSPAETAAYVAHRLAVAGLAGPMPFAAAALRRLHRHAGGVPRRINLLADRALLGAYSLGRRGVDRRIVDRAAAEVFGRDRGTPARWPRGLAAAAALAAVATAAGVVWQSQRRPTERNVVVASVAAPASGAADRAASAVRAASAAPPADADNAPSSAPLFDAAADLPQLPRDERALWRELAGDWGLTLPAGEPCLVAARQQLPCYRNPNATLALIRQLDRPGLLMLAGPGGREFHARLVALDAQAAELAEGDRRWRLPLDQLAALWRGEFATFWRAPDGYERPLGEGARGPAVLALATALSVQPGAAPALAAEPADAPGNIPGSAPGNTPGSTLDGALRDRLAGFQLARGLQPDGLAGPTTFMLLNRAAGVKEPRLSAAAQRPKSTE